MKKYALFVAVLLAVVLVVSVNPVQAEVTYQVKSGDTLWNISQYFDIPVRVLLRQNNISNPGNLYVGQELIITRTNNSITITFGNGSNLDNNNTTNYFEYYVKPGDTLWKIAQRFNTTMEKLVELNDNIDYTYNIYVGQKLIVPGQNNNRNNNNNLSNQPRYTYYTVKPGDILWNIAQKFNTTVARLVELNNIRNAYDLYVGRRLIVEVNEPVTQPEVSPTRQPYVPYYFYKIQEGDLIWNIADRFGIRVSELVEANNITDVNQIQTGRVLVIPLEKSTKFSYIQRMNRKLKNYYRVRGNETLADIAAYFKIPEEGLRAINHLASDEEVYTGQLLLMPVSSAFFKKHEIYTVRRNNMPIHEIAYQKGISIRSILQANYMKNINAKFKAGTTLIIPLDKDSKAVWVDYENGKPVNSWFN
ncbi:MAG: hypothetical protein PWR10_2343 [Halanaerobiales bacterium]|nr:hypothetical protein [Halanaerobiales bacterium]